jgi:hypothetical protein
MNNVETTAPQAPEAARLAELDGVLAQHPFGNSDYITEQMHAAFTRRLASVATRMPSAARLAEALERVDAYGQYRVLGDMVVRCTIQHARKQLETGEPWGIPLEICDEIFDLTGRQAENGVYGPIGSGLEDRIGPEPHHGWIWGDRREDVVTTAFRHVVVLDYQQVPCAIEPEEKEMLVKGTELVAKLLPRMGRSALSHVHLVAGFSRTGSWAARSSSSEFRLSGTIFLSQAMLTNPWAVAEHVFHEALHQQLYDFRQAHSLLRPDFDRADAPLICSLWNLPDPTGGNYWDSHRSLAALHVYVHLALLSALAEARADELEAEYGRQVPGERMTPSRTALSRAHYLDEQVKGPFWDELGPAGQSLVEWFSSVLETIDTAPPPPGSFMHLVLDRYQREAMQIALLGARAEDQPPDFSDQLAALAREEVARVRSVLAGVQANGELDHFNEAVAMVFDEEGAALLPDGDPGKQFARLRGQIITSLLRASVDGYRLSDSRVPDDSVKRMIDESGERVMALVAGADHDDGEGDPRG